MGCGTSKDDTGKDDTDNDSVITSPDVFFLHKEKEEEERRRQRDAQLLAEVQAAEASAAEDDRSGEPQVIVAVKDESTEKPKTNEEPKSYLDDDDEIGDGLLGVTETSELTKVYSSIPSGGLFYDGDFPAEDSSVYYTGGHQLDGMTWCRPKDLVGDEASVQKSGMTRGDVVQGELGDCWFLSSLAAVSTNENFMKKIIPQEQVLSGPSYKGVIQVRFWRFGRWVDVIIDDQLPARHDQLVFGSCTDRTEFWVALVEKAYAKLHGSYEAMEGGQSMDALVDLTGGLGEVYETDPANPDPDLYKKLLRAHRAGSYITCSIKKVNWQQGDKGDSNGLIAGHAYSITMVNQVNPIYGNDGKRDSLLRIRNPWGNDVEWKGRYSDDDRAWMALDHASKRYMEPNKEPDGEFWMTWEDFCTHFQKVTICTVGPDFDGDGVTDSGGQVDSVEGEWTPGTSAGGCRNNMDMFATNPQVQFDLTQPDDFNEFTDDPSCKGNCSVVISLMQEHRRSKRHLGVKMLQIGFVIYKSDQAGRRLPLHHFQYNYDAGTSGSFINSREVSQRFELKPGTYVIIPSTFASDLQGRFLIRVFAKQQPNLQRLQDFTNMRVVCG